MAELFVCRLLASPLWQCCAFHHHAVWILMKQCFFCFLNMYTRWFHMIPNDLHYCKTFNADYTLFWKQADACWMIVSHKKVVSFWLHRGAVQCCQSFLNDPLIFVPNFACLTSMVDYVIQSNQEVNVDFMQPPCFTSYKKKLC
jgi:hypothetical protein